MRKKIIVPIFILLIIIVFYIRKLLFGFQNANKYLSTIDKRAIIPILKLNGAKVGTNCDIEAGITFHNCNSYTNLIIGDNCHIGKNCFLDLTNKITIDNNCTISMEVQLITHIDVGKSKLVELYSTESNPIKICENVYVGTRTTILKGITINKNNFIAAMSLVNRSLEANQLNVGIPVECKRKLEF